MSAAEFLEWQAFERVEGPIGGRRDDVLAALTAYYTVLPHLKEGADITPDDFLAQFDPEAKSERRHHGHPEEVNGFYG